MLVKSLGSQYLRLGPSMMCSGSFVALQPVRGGAILDNGARSMATTARPLAFRAHVAVGSNVGDRFGNIHRALRLLCQSANVKLIRTSFLHETAPMYVTDQPEFLNGVVQIETDLRPLELLEKIKQVESTLGRDFEAVRNGPRPVDLDILMYETSKEGEPIIVETEQLAVPHPRMGEREFVLRPLREVANQDLVHPTLNASIDLLLLRLQNALNSTEPTAVRVLPLPRGRMLHLNRTLIMGILNVTPDSFSDGGKWNDTVSVAVQRALEMEREGAAIVDVGGESTRPGAAEVEVAVELERTVPVIKRIRDQSDIPISIDTRHSEVARAAVLAGADIVNDVSGGTHDPNMLSVVAELRVPIILMHMRGTPATMLSLTEYDDIVNEVAEALIARSKAAEEAGISRWLQVVDPGIGFAKDLRGNVVLLKNIGRLREACGNIPIVLGTSRKGFIGKLTGASRAEDRDPGTIASYVAALCLEAPTRVHSTIIRVHNVAAHAQAVTVMDAIRHAN